MEKNVAGKWVVFAYGTPAHATLAGLPVTGLTDITANIRIDGGAANAVDDLNPTELEDGYYVFDITAVESNGDLLSLHPASATANVAVIGVPGAVYTRPANFNTLGIETDGDLTQVNNCVANTDMRGTDGANTATPLDAAGIRAATGLASANLDTQLDAIPTVAELNARTLAAADYFDPALDTVATVSTVTSLTNLPSIPAGWITAAGITASALDGKGDWNTVVPDAAGVAATPAEVATALTDIHLDHLFAVDYDPATPPGTATALLNEIIESDAGVSRFTINALENAPSGSAASAAAIADAVWDEAQSGHTTAGTFGKFLDTEVSGVGGGSAAAIADAVWDEARSGHVTAGTFGESVNADLIASQSNTVTFPAFSITGEMTVGDGINVDVTTTGKAAMNLKGLGSGQGLYIEGGATSGTAAMRVLSPVAANAAGIECTGTTEGASFTASNGSGFKCEGSGGGLVANGTAGGSGIVATGNGSGEGISALGGSSGSGAQFQGGTNGNGLSVFGVGTGHGLFAFVAGSGNPIEGDVNGNLSGSVGSVTDTASIADAVWDELTADHVIAGSTGESVAAGGDATAANQTSILTELSDIKGATWDSSNSLEAIHDDQNITSGNVVAVAGVLNQVNTLTESILIDTETTLPAQIATAQADLDTLTGADGVTLATLQPNYAPATAAEVNAQVLDVIETDLFAELAGVPAASSSLKDKITWVFMLARNQIEQTSTTQTVKADNTTTTVATATISDDGTTATRGELT